MSDGLCLRADAFRGRDATIQLKAILVWRVPAYGPSAGQLCPGRRTRSAASTAGRGEGTGGDAPPSHAHTDALDDLKDG